MGGLPGCPVSLLISIISWILLLMGSSSCIPLAGTGGFPSELLTMSLSSSPALVENSTASSDPDTSRVKRSCGHHSVGLIFLEACNKNHKRSPFIINVILMEYYIMPDLEGEPGAVANREMKLQDQEFPNPIISAWIITSSDNDDGEGKRLPPMGDMDRSLNRLPAPAAPSSASWQRERPKRAPVAAVNFHTLLEKCCSSAGCGSSDFTNLC